MPGLEKALPERVSRWPISCSQKVHWQQLVRYTQVQRSASRPTPASNQRDVASERRASQLCYAFSGASRGMPYSEDDGAPTAVASSSSALLGQQSMVQLMGVWGQLAPRLPQQQGSDQPQDLILTALKLAVASLQSAAAASGREARQLVAPTLELAGSLADLCGSGVPLDPESIAAGIMADACHQELVSTEVVQQRLGLQVASLVHDILRARAAPERVELYVDSAASAARELCLSFLDVRAVVVEVVARWERLKRMDALPLYEQQLAALEALQVYAPLGHALGLGPVSAQMEDLCFKVLFPDSYAQTTEWVRSSAEESQAVLGRCQQGLQQLAAQDQQFQQLAAGVKIRARTKSMFSVMKKLLQLSSAQGRGKTRQDIYDLHGLRAVVQPRTDLPPEQAEQAAQQACYRLQQLAEMVWAPLQQRSKDYISQPKANGYRSMHLTLAVPSEQASASSSSCSSDEEEQLASRINSNSQASSSSSSSSKAAQQQQQQPNYESWLSGPLYVELQIRTQLMDEQAEMGAAAHAGYKGGLDARQAQQLQSWTQELQRRLLLQPQQKLQLPVRPISGLPAAAAEAAEGEAGSDPAAAWAAAEGLFRHLDRDGDGRLSLNELQLLMQELGAPASSRDAAELMALLDTNGDQDVSLQEFLDFYKKAGMLRALPAVDRATVSTLRHHQNGGGVSASAAAAALALQARSSQSVGSTGSGASAWLSSSSMQWQGAGLQRAGSYSTADSSSAPAVALAGAGMGGGRLARRVMAGFVRLEALASDQDDGASGSSSSSSSSSSTGAPGNGAVAAAGSGSNGSTVLANGSSRVDSESSSSSSSSTQIDEQHSSSEASASHDPLQQQQAPAESSSTTSSSDNSSSSSSSSGPTTSRAVPPPAFLQRPARAPTPAPSDTEPSQQQAQQQPAPAAATATDSWDEAELLALEEAWQQQEQQVMGLQLVATTEHPLMDASGRALQSPNVPIPAVGALVVSNSSKAYPGTDVLVDYQTDGYDRLCMRLEYVTDQNTGRTRLCLWNRSRYARGRLQHSVVLVNGQAVQQFSDQVELQPGDEVCLGAAHVSFRVEAVLAGQVQLSATMLALQKYCGDVDLSQIITSSSSSGGGSGGPMATASEDEEAGSSNGGGSSSSSSSSFSMAGPLDAQLYKLYRSYRKAPHEADAQLQALAVAQPDNAGVWWVWAQVAVALRRPAMARDLLRAAAHCCKQAAHLQRRQRQQEQLQLREQILRSLTASSSSHVHLDDYGSSDGGWDAEQQQRAGGASALRWAERLTQVLATWAALEWDLKQFGSARRLYRAAADEALQQQRQRRLPPGAPTVGYLLHSWATKEYERDNVRNARIIVTEALRKCPDDAGLYVLAAGIESKAGNRQLAQSLYMDAFRLNKSDKHLYLGWPKLEADMGNVERARALFQKGLSLHPYNTKIMNACACFEADQGNADEARELHKRALALDGSSATTMHNRVSWATLEASLGKLEEARGILQEALDLYPDWLAALVTLCSVERKSGRLEVAEALARRALKLSCGHYVAALKELQLLYEARQEPALAANYGRHVGAVSGMVDMKRAGAWGSEAWQKFYERAERPAARAVAKAARKRKQELGFIRKRQYEPRPGRAAAAEAAAAAGAAAGAAEAADEVAAAAYYGVRPAGAAGCVFPVGVEGSGAGGLVEREQQDEWGEEGEEDEGSGGDGDGDAAESSLDESSAVVVGSGLSS